MKKIIYFILKLFGIELDNSQTINNKTDTTIYKIKPLMSNYERYFYNILKELEPNYKVIPQLNLASVITKINNNHYYTDLYRNVDFAIFDSNLENLLLLIEIDDKSHSNYKRQERDLKVKKICDEIDIDLIHFYTNYPNKQEYVYNRIITILQNKNT